MKKTACWLLACLIVATAAAQDARAEPGQNPPRYRLMVGQKLEYLDRRQSDEKNDSRETFRLTYWVVAQNADESWRLLFRHGREKNWTGGKGEPRTRSSDEYGYFDLFADGRVIPCKKDLLLAPELFFLRLPDRPLTGDTTWESESSDGWTKYFCKASPPAADAQTWTFTARKQRRDDAIHEVSAEVSQTFDLAHGLVQSATSRLGQNRYDPTTVTGLRELTANEQLPDDEARQLAREATIYFRAVEEAQPLVERAGQDLDATARLFDEAEAVYAGLEAQLELPLLRTIVAADRKACADEREFSVDVAQRYGKLMNLPAPEWQTVDLDGTAHALKDYRGRVVLLDFWYRGCGACMRSLPDVNRLASEFKDQPVTILSVSTDRDPDDARVVVDTFGLTYPTLRDSAKEDSAKRDGAKDDGAKDDESKQAVGIAKRYSIEAVPTFVLIDRQGIVRKMYCGYWSALHDELAEQIRAALADSPPTGPIKKR